MNRVIGVQWSSSAAKKADAIFDRHRAPQISALSVPQALAQFFGRGPGPCAGIDYLSAPTYAPSPRSQHRGPGDLTDRLPHRIVLTADSARPSPPLTQLSDHLPMNH